MPRKRKAEPVDARETEIVRMWNGSQRLRDLVVNRSFPASVPVERLRKVNDLLGQALLFLSTPAESTRSEGP